jgi:hypothetical protein
MKWVKDMVDFFVLICGIAGGILLKYMNLWQKDCDLW